MISVRRLIASLLAGALLVLASAAQASAQPAADLDRAFEGVALGLAAAAELAGDGDVIVVDESLIAALGAYEAWAAKFAESNGRGLGPVNAAAVHQALLDGDVPGQLVKDSGSKLAGLSGMYEVLKGKSDAAKEAKDKSNNGKSHDKSNNGKPDDDSSDDDDSADKSESDKDSSESSRGQQNRP